MKTASGFVWLCFPAKRKNFLKLSMLFIVLKNHNRAAVVVGGRATIIQFSTRTYRDAIWKAARNYFLCNNGLQFREDFAKGDRERRIKLWLEVQKV